MFTGPAGMFILRQSTTVRARLYTLKSHISKHTRCYFLFSFLFFFHFHVLVKVNSLTFTIRNFHPYFVCVFVSQHFAAAVWLKQLAISLQQKKQCWEKGKQIRYMKKEKRNRKWQDSWKWATSGEERLWLTNDEVKSSIGDHHTLLDAQPSS